MANPAQLPKASDEAAPAAPSFTFSKSLATLRPEGSGEAESFRALRTHIVARHVEEGRRAITICSVTPNVGCSYVASNLAVSLSQIGLKTLLIDANLRSPGIDRVFIPSDPQIGLWQCLMSSGQDYAEYIQEDILPDLSVMFAGGAPYNPQELLASERFSDLMSFCLRDYEMTVIDTPPASTCSDAIRVSSVAGYSLVVARQHRTLVNDVRTLIAQLESDRARVIGTVMNEAP